MARMICCLHLQITAFLKSLYDGFGPSGSRSYQLANSSLNPASALSASGSWGSIAWANLSYRPTRASNCGLEIWSTSASFGGGGICCASLKSCRGTGLRRSLGVRRKVCRFSMMLGRRNKPSCPTFPRHIPNLPLSEPSSPPFCTSWSSVLQAVWLLD